MRDTYTPREPVLKFAHQWEKLVKQCATAVGESSTKSGELIGNTIIPESRFTNFAHQMIPAYQRYRNNVKECFEEKFTDQALKIRLSEIKQFTLRTPESKKDFLDGQIKLLKYLDETIQGVMPGADRSEIFKKYEENFTIEERSNLIPRGIFESFLSIQGHGVAWMDNPRNLGRLLYLLVKQKFLILNGCEALAEYKFDRSSVNGDFFWNAEDYTFNSEKFEEVLKGLDHAYLFWYGLHYHNVIQVTEEEKEEELDVLAKDIRSLFDISEDQRLKKLEKESWVKLEPLGQLKTKEIILSEFLSKNNLIIGFAKLALRGKEEKKLLDTAKAEPLDHDDLLPAQADDGVIVSRLEGLKMLELRDQAKNLCDSEVGIDDSLDHGDLSLAQLPDVGQESLDETSGMTWPD